MTIVLAIVYGAMIAQAGWEIFRSGQTTPIEDTCRGIELNLQLIVL